MSKKKSKQTNTATSPSTNEGFGPQQTTPGPTSVQGSVLGFNEPPKSDLVKLVDKAEFLKQEIEYELTRIEDLRGSLDATKARLGLHRLNHQETQYKVMELMRESLNVPR